jgi:hypothetical protein
MPVFIPVQRFAAELGIEMSCALGRAITGSAVMMSANMIALIIFTFVIVAISVASPLFAKRRHIIGVPPLHEFKEPHR